MVLGCQINHLEVGLAPMSPGWDLESVPSGDFETVCAAGYAMEVLLGRRQDAAWDQCTGDRQLLTALDARRTGVEMDRDTSTARFRAAAEMSRAILAHGTVRTTIDLLAEALSDAYDSGEGHLSGDVVRDISAPILGDFRV